MPEPSPVDSLGELSLHALWWGQDDTRDVARSVWQFLELFGARLGPAGWYVSGYGNLANANDLLQAGGEPHYPDGVRVDGSAIHPDEAKAWSAWPATRVNGRTTAVSVDWRRHGLSTESHVVIGVQGDADAGAEATLARALDCALRTLPIQMASISSLDDAEIWLDLPHDLPTVGRTTWLKGVSPNVFRGSDAHDVSVVAGGVQFHVAPEHLSSIQKLLTDSEILGPLNPINPDFIGTLPGPDQAFRDYITGVVPTPDGAIPMYVVQHPDGGSVAFEGHVWRDSDNGPVEVYLTSLGGYGPLLRTDPRARLALQNVWATDARRQHDVVPATARNEWHVDDRVTYDTLVEALEPQHSDAIVYLHPR